MKYQEYCSILTQGDIEDIKFVNASYLLDKDLSDGDKKDIEKALLAKVVQNWKAAENKTDKVKAGTERSDGMMKKRGYGGKA